MNRTPNRLDAHQHFWKIERGDYGWLTPSLTTLYRDFIPADLAPLLDSHHVTGTVLVQAAPTSAETDYMLSLADKHPFIKGVVGWVNFENKDAPDQIERLAEHPKLVGLRPMIQDLPDDNWMLRPELTQAFDAIERLSLTFDALTLPRHLKPLLNLLERHSGMRVVIDHGSKPNIASGALSGWAEDIAALASNTEAYCKMSGLVTEAGDTWSFEDLQPFVEHLLDTFGPERLIWGSDWPVCTLAAEYKDWISASECLLFNLSETDANKVWYQNAVDAYGLDLDH